MQRVRCSQPLRDCRDVRYAKSCSVDVSPRRFPAHQWAPGPLRRHWHPAPANSPVDGDRQSTAVFEIHASIGNAGAAPVCCMHAAHDRAVIGRHIRHWTRCGEVLLTGLLGVALRSYTSGAGLMSSGMGFAQGVCRRNGTSHPAGIQVSLWRLRSVEACSHNRRTLRHTIQRALLQLSARTCFLASVEVTGNHQWHCLHGKQVMFVTCNAEASPSVNTAWKEYLCACCGCAGEVWFWFWMPD